MKINFILFLFTITVIVFSCKKKESQIITPIQNVVLSQPPPIDTSVFLTYFPGNRAFNQPAIDKDGAVWTQISGQFNNQLAKVNKSGYTKTYKVPDDFGNCFSLSIAIDSHNNKWLCVSNGSLYKFDGKVYTKTNAWISSGVRTKMTIDEFDNLWMANESGLYKYNGITTQHWAWNTSEYGGVWTMAFDQQGILWIGCDQGLCMFNGTTFTRYTYQSNYAENQAINCISFDSKGKLWMGNGPYLSSFENGVWQRHRLFMDDLGSYAIFAINFDAQGTMWIGHKKGVTCFDGTTYTDVAALRGYAVRGGAMDNNGNFWYTTDDDHGLIKLKAQ